MKITKSQLKRLVEQVAQAHPRGDLGKNVADVDFPVLVTYEGKSEIAYNQDELDDILDYVAPMHGAHSGIAYSIDSLADVEVKDLPAGAKIEMMESAKISKSTIRDIIKESVRTVAEQVVGYEAPKGSDDEDSGESNKDWVQTGTLSGAADDDKSLDQRVATSTRQTTQQRQQDLDKGDAVAADEDGEELQGLVSKQTEAVHVKKSMLLSMIRESLLLEQDSILIDYVKEEIANSDDPEPGVISREELRSRSEGAGYEGDEIDEAIATLLEDGEVTEEDEVLTLTK